MTEITLPTLATKADVWNLGYSMTWRFLSALIVILLAYLGAVWFVVSLVLRGPW